MPWYFGRGDCLRRFFKKLGEELNLWYWVYLRGWCVKLRVFWLLVKEIFWSWGSFLTFLRSTAHFYIKIAGVFYRYNLFKILITLFEGLGRTFPKIKVEFWRSRWWFLKSRSRPLPFKLSHFFTFHQFRFQSITFGIFRSPFSRSNLFYQR